MTLKAVFRLALRQTEGLIGSGTGLLGLTLALPDHSTLSRRSETLEVPRPQPCRGGEPPHLLVDSAGLTLCGAGEWLVEKHGTRTRRSPRKLHIGLDAGTGQIVAAALTRKALLRLQPNAILKRLSSCRRVARSCRARPQKARSRSGTATCKASPSMGGLPGR